jgi:hypothetical protein
MTSTRPTTVIRLAGPTDVDTVTAVLTEAFLDSPVGDWLIPDIDTRRDVYMDYFRIHADHALHGTVPLPARTRARHHLHAAQAPPHRRRAHNGRFASRDEIHKEQM